MKVCIHKDNVKYINELKSQGYVRIIERVKTKGIIVLSNIKNLNPKVIFFG